jgi:hypothetical protein
MSDDAALNLALVGICSVCGAPVETSVKGFRAGVACTGDPSHRWWEGEPPCKSDKKAVNPLQTTAPDREGEAREWSAEFHASGGGAAVATAQIVEADPARFQVVVESGESLHTEVASTLADARDRVARTVHVICPDARSAGWVAGPNPARGPAVTP